MANHENQLILPEFGLIHPFPCPIGKTLAKIKQENAPPKSFTMTPGPAPSINRKPTNFA
jgi:hypothetical protein